VNQEEIGEYIPDFFPSDDYQDQEEEVPHRIEEEPPFETYSIPCGWDIEKVLWFFKSEVARQYLTATLYYEGVLGDGVNKVVIRESESHNEQNEVAVWDKREGTLSITC
ncbi:hypothetical protein ACHJH3_10980, partial [Campylobacter sp. MOP7]|uniref:hypothetical protein n=1 Tax=Campylobacter canis TaxID=3378588 RepID=UPI00387EC98E